MSSRWWLLDPRFIHRSLPDVCLCRSAVRRGPSYPFRFPSPDASSFRKGRLQPRGSWVRRELRSPRLDSPTVLIPCPDWSQGCDRYCRTDCRDRFHPTPLVKALEHVMVNYDGMVRNSLGHFIQFVYGEDGMDGAFIERQHIDTFSLNSWEFKHNYRVDIIDPHFAFLPSVLQIGIDNSSPEL